MLFKCTVGGSDWRRFGTCSQTTIRSPRCRRSRALVHFLKFASLSRWWEYRALVCIIHVKQSFYSFFALTHTHTDAHAHTCMIAERERRNALLGATSGFSLSAITACFPALIYADMRRDYVCISVSMHHSKCARTDRRRDGMMDGCTCNCVCMCKRKYVGR